ncbi:phage holin, LLH family [Streptococcus sp. H31]|uniref:phage holin, LLH family n=1 Tax=Streptococcus huangxiaojuni TaxID=3237239 RepID=UPI0034A309E4
MIINIMKMIEELIENITLVIVILGALSPLFYQFLLWLKARTANARIKVLEDYAMRVVQALEQYANFAGSDKKKLALQKLSEYIAESPLKFKVSANQLDDLIEAAVNKLKDSSTPGVKVEQETIFNDDLEIGAVTLSDDEQAAAVAEFEKYLAGEGE